MREKVVGAIILTVILMAFSAPAIAQYEKIDKLPAHEDFVYDLQPDGFVHAYEKGTLNKFIIEYIPKGESLQNWTRMLSIMALGAAQTLPDIDRYSSLLFQSLQKSCETLAVEKVSVSEGDARFRVACDPVAAGKSIIGGEGLRWELGVCRFVRTDDALYQIHYVEHGTDPPSESRREQIYADAATAVNEVLVCNLSGSGPCPPLDVYTLGSKLPPVEGEPPCRSNEAVSCNPAAFFMAPAAAGLPTDQSAKQGLLIVNFAEEDLTTVATLNKYAGALISNLKEGRPAVTLIVRGPSPDYAIKAEDRVRVGTFLMLLRSILVGRRAIDPNKMEIIFMNFR